MATIEYIHDIEPQDVRLWTSPKPSVPCTDDVDVWNVRPLIDWYKQPHNSVIKIEVMGGGIDVRSKFEELAADWRKKTRSLSSLKEIVLNPSYQYIIGLGPVVIPLILAEMSERPNHWFMALKTLTQGIDPAQQATTMQEATLAWLTWGKEHGYL
jgi:hypothetical protein